MAREKGIVQDIENDFAWVLTRRKEACGDCGHKHHCSTVEGVGRMVMKAKIGARVRVGDEVELHLSTKTKLKGLFVLYLFPVIGIVVGAISGKSASEFFGLNPSAGTAVFMVVGFIAAVLLGRFVGGRMEARQELMPLIVRVVGRAARSAMPVPPNITDSDPESCCAVTHH
jgi:sigma-E factor negative regulatory protein RseC